MEIVFAAAAAGYLLRSVPFGLVLTRLSRLGAIRGLGSRTTRAATRPRPRAPGPAAARLPLHAAH